MARIKRPGRRPHSISSLTRKQGRRPPRRSVLVVCGGTETEPRYFCSLRRDLKLTTVDVRIEGTGQDPLNVVDHTISIEDRGKTIGETFDEIWCVLDVENPNENPGFYKAVNRARGNGIELAISNPAFEYWYLLHFKETDRPFRDAAELIKELRDFVPGYQKSSDMFSILCEYTDVAVKRAVLVLGNRPDQSVEFPNPSTSVFELVEKLRGMSEYE
jgi:hypothetical protein